LSEVVKWTHRNPAVEAAALHDLKVALVAIKRLILQMILSEHLFRPSECYLLTS
jgi:hypothetical protein